MAGILSYVNLASANVCIGFLRKNKSHQSLVCKVAFYTCSNIVVPWSRGQHSCFSRGNCVFESKQNLIFFPIFLFLNDVEKSHFHMFIGPKIPSNLCGHYNASILLKKRSFSLISGFPTNCAGLNCTCTIHYKQKNRYSRYLVWFSQCRYSHLHFVYVSKRQMDPCNRPTYFRKSESE